jgi:hypothetical protein
LVAYKDDVNEKEINFSIPIHSVSIVDRGFFLKVFEVTHLIFDNKSQSYQIDKLIQKYMQIKEKRQVSCDEEDFFRWKAAFTNGGMLVEKSVSATFIGPTIIVINFFLNDSWRRKRNWTDKLKKSIHLLVSIFEL